MGLLSEFCLCDSDEIDVPTERESPIAAKLPEPLAPDPPSSAPS
jgi:hypothetical protein